MSREPGKLDYKSLWEDDDSTDAKPADQGEFAELLSHEKTQTFQRLRTGEPVEARVMSVGEGSIFCDIGQRAEAVVDKAGFTAEELNDIKAGTVLRLFVVKQTASGIELSRSLSARDMGKDALQQAYNSGIPVEGKVTGTNKGGFTVTVAGADCFVPFSQMDTARRPETEYIGKVFKFRISRIQGREAVLSRVAILHEEQSEVRAKLLNELEVGQVRNGSVVKIEKFGAFVDIGGGVHGLVPLSQMSWSRVQDAQSAGVEVGQAVSVKILEIDRSGPKLKILLSIKQAGVDPREASFESIQVGQVVKGTVTRLMNFGAFVEIMPGVEGLLHISEMSAKRRIMQPGEVVQVGQTLELSITAVDRINMRISLSLKAKDQEMLDAETKAKYLAKDKADDEHRGVELVSEGKFGALGEAFRNAKQGRQN